MPYIGEIRIFAGNFPPRGWAFCDGQLLGVDQFPTLYARLGNRFGGDETTFALPDLRGRVAIQAGASVALGEAGGSEIVALDETHLPAHMHGLRASSNRARDTEPAGHVIAAGRAARYVSEPATAGTVTLAPTYPAGVGNAHENLQPFLCLNYIIALDGADS